MMTYNDQIECGRCGEKFYYELTRCPYCGVSVYYPDNGEDGRPPGRDRIGDLFAAAETPLHSVLVVFLSWLAAAALAMVMYIPLRTALGESPSSFVIQAMISVTVALGALVGGYLAGRFARIRRLAHGWWVGGLSLAWVLLLAAREFADLLMALLSPLLILGAGLIVLAAYSGASLAARMVRDQMAAELFAGVNDEAALYQDLLVRVAYDRSISERLIEFERKRNPQAGRAELIRLAIERWERDNRASYSGELE